MKKKYIELSLPEIDLKMEIFNDPDAGLVIKFYNDMNELPIIVECSGGLPGIFGPDVRFSLQTILDDMLEESQAGASW